MNIKRRNVAYFQSGGTRIDPLREERLALIRFAAENGLGKLLFIEERREGKTSWRERKISKVVAALQAGDRLVVPRLSGLGENPAETIEVLAAARKRGVTVYAAAGGWRIDDRFDHRTMRLVGDLVRELERDFPPGSARGRKSGKRKRPGRPRGPGRSKLDQHRREIIRLLGNGATKTFVAGKFNTSQGNLYNWLKKNKISI